MVKMNWFCLCLIALLGCADLSLGSAASSEEVNKVNATRSESPVASLPIKVRVVSYNVETGKKGKPSEIATVFSKFQPDIIGFSEVPNGDWTARVGKHLGMDYHYVGAIASKHHTNKYKSILSRTPLTGMEEFELNVDRGWNPASAVRAKTVIRGLPITIYSVHFSRSAKRDGHAYAFVSDVLSKDDSQHIVMTGDLNNEVQHPALDTLREAGLRPVWDDLDVDMHKLTSVVKRSRHGVLDHILYSEKSGAKVTIAGVVDLAKPLSDHKPVYAEIVYPAKPTVQVIE